MNEGNKEDMAERNVPIVVDLDGTLIKTDLLLESFYRMIRKNPFLLFRVPLWLLGGKARFKAQLARRVSINAKTLPYNADFLAYLKDEFSGNRKIVLATASVKKFALSVAEHLGIFSEVLASDEKLNLSGKNKLRLLLERFGEKGFDYAGNAGPDLHIFAHARQVILVNPGKGVMKAAEKKSEITKIFQEKANKFALYLKSIRVYQWIKNLLLFVPLFTSHHWNNLPACLSVALGFISFNLCASGGYLLNDLLDLPADRKHPRKRLRPLPSGNISLWSGSTLMVMLYASGLLLASLLSRGFFAALALYCLISFAYTVYLKTYVLIDVLVLAGLYTLRVIAGAILADVPLSFWLLAFSVFIFFSLALVKRCSELLTLSKTNAEYADGRDYLVSDMDHLREMGITSGYLAIFIVSFYINSPDVATLYTHPKVLWMTCPALFYWISRIWLKTGRGEMTDDPIVFSFKDRGSRFIAVCLIIIVLLAI